MEVEEKVTTADAGAEMLRSRIVHVLTVFPFLSQSMINVGIGTSIPSKLWQPILEDLIAEGTVQKTAINAQSPSDRSQTYTIYHLSKNAYSFNQDDA